MYLRLVLCIALLTKTACWFLLGESTIRHSVIEQKQIVIITTTFRRAAYRKLILVKQILQYNYWNSEASDCLKYGLYGASSNPA